MERRTYRFFVDTRRISIARWEVGDGEYAWLTHIEGQLLTLDGHPTLRDAYLGACRHINPAAVVDDVDGEMIATMLRPTAELERRGLQAPRRRWLALRRAR